MITIFFELLIICTEFADDGFVKLSVRGDEGSYHDLFLSYGCIVMSDRFLMTDSLPVPAPLDAFRGRERGLR